QPFVNRPPGVASLSWRTRDAESDLERCRARRERSLRDRRGELLLCAGDRRATIFSRERDPHHLPVERHGELLRRRGERRDEQGRVLVLPGDERGGGADQGPRRLLAGRAERALTASRRAPRSDGAPSDRGPATPPKRRVQLGISARTRFYTTERERAAP